ncbi:WhiB family transcriptional regulator [Streptomyces sp. DH8]|uniref:WhiB family transcriptional regulator n=1 Tax=Streptomyces sp. DH8 TaxID=2857008 RepID=UPI001E4F4E11|nr:WhiB family transcriptional regulator [Streptomyces sp. DH8]
MTTTVDAIAARQRLVDDRHYKYRGCAPDPDMPTMAAGDPDVPLDAWGPYTDDGAEAQKTRLDRERAALTICGRCPVLALCRTYANTTTVEVDAHGRQVEHLVEPEGVMGGQTALARHKALIKRKHAEAATAVAPARDLADARTAQKVAVLLALAAEVADVRVARRAGMDLRTCNWHRSALCSLLGLDKETATRDELLQVAVLRGLLPSAAGVVWDGLWPIAAAPTTDGVRQRRIAPDMPLAALIPQPRTRTRRRRASAAPGPATPRFVAQPLFPVAALITPAHTRILEPAA